MFHFPYCGFQPIFFAQVAVVRGVTKTQRANSCGSALLRSVLQLPKNICQPGSRPLAAAMAERVIPTVIEVDVDAGPPVWLYKKSAWFGNLWVVRKSICSVVNDIFHPLYWVSAYLNILTKGDALTTLNDYLENILNML